MKKYIILKLFVYISTFFTFGILLFLIGHILVKGLPYITPALFDWTYTTHNVSMTHAIINTIVMTMVSLIISVPIGIFTAIYMIEYASVHNKLIGLIRISVQTLSGIPSIVYGLFGLLFFVTTLGWGYSILAGAFTLAIMILPMIIRATEEALMSVPNAFREGSFALGAGKLRTLFNIIVPAAFPGIMAGVILGIGRIVGETAALIYTSGSVAQVATGVMQSGRTLAIHMYALSSEGLYTNQAYATAVVLFVVVVGINSFSAYLAKTALGKA